MNFPESVKCHWEAILWKERGGNCRGEDNRIFECQTFLNPESLPISLVTCAVSLNPRRVGAFQECPYGSWYPLLRGASRAYQSLCVPWGNLSYFDRNPLCVQDGDNPFCLSLKDPAPSPSFSMPPSAPNSTSGALPRLKDASRNLSAHCQFRVAACNSVSSERGIVPFRGSISLRRSVLSTKTQPAICISAW